MVKTYRPFPNAADEEERHGGEGRQADQYSDRIRPVREYVLAITRHLVRIYLIHEHHLRTGNQTGVEGGGGGRGREGGGWIERAVISCVNFSGEQYSSMVQRPIKNLIFLIGADFGTPSPGRLYEAGA